MSTPAHSKRRHANALLLALSLGGCGFRWSLPASYNFGAILIPASGSGLLAELSRTLAVEGKVTVLDDPKQYQRADIRFELLHESRDKVVLGRNTVGGVREYQLRLRVRFKVLDRSGAERVPSTELVQQRELSFHEAQALSKETEEQLLYQSMQSEVVLQITRRLARMPAAPKG